jgi:hypothetical protein
MVCFEAYLSQTIRRKEIDFLVAVVASDPKRLHELICLVEHENQQTGWHAAWCLEKLFEKYPELFTYQMLDRITEIAIETKREGTRRLMLSILRTADLPVVLPVELINKAFEWILSEVSAIAVKALSIHYLLRVCKREPDLLPELQLCVSQLLDNTDSPGIRSVAKKVMKANILNCK